MNSQSAANFALQRDPWGRLVLVDVQGRRHEGVVPARAFPVPTWNTGCRSAMPTGGRFSSSSDWPTFRRPCGSFQDELNVREFVPTITRIVSASREEPSQWCVETDRGPTTFQVNSEDDVRRAEPHQDSSSIPTAPVT